MWLKIMKLNRCEAEIDVIRLKRYEATKHFTREEDAKRLRDKTQKLVAQYGFTSEMALKLAKAFNTSAQFWLNGQQTYDLWQAKQRVDLSKVQVIAI